METLKDYIEKLDNGQIVESVNMGGMGYGYELAIQKLAVQTIRELVNNSELDVSQAANVACAKLKDEGFTGRNLEQRQTLRRYSTNKHR